MASHNRRFPLPLLVILPLLFLATPSLVAYAADWLWFDEIGYRQAYLTMIGAQAALFLIVTVVSVVWLLANVLGALQSVGDIRPVIATREGMQMTLPGRRQLALIARIVVLVVSVLVGMFA